MDNEGSPVVIVADELKPESAEPEPGAVETVVAAEAAVSLANATAASAELQAAERVAAVEEGADEWRTQTESRMATLAETAERLSQRLSELSSREEEESLLESALLARLDEIESQLSTPASPASNPSNPPTSNETENPNPPILGTAGEVTAGPVAVEAGVGVGGSAPAPKSNRQSASTAPREQKHRWI